MGPLFLFEALAPLGAVGARLFRLVMKAQLGALGLLGRALDQLAGVPWPPLLRWACRRREAVVRLSQRWLSDLRHLQAVLAE